MGRGRIRVVEDDYSSSDSDSKYGDPIRIERQDTKIYRSASKSKRPHDHRRATEGTPVIIQNRLAVPMEAGGRHRANSAGGMPAPVVLIPQMERSPSRSRHRHHHSHYSSSSSDRSRSRHGGSKRGSQVFAESDLPYEFRRKLDLAAEAEERRSRDWQWEAEKAKIARDQEDQERKDKERRDRYLRDFEDERRKADERRASIIREQEDKDREAKRKREEMARQLREEEEEKKRKEEELEKRILADAEAKKKKKEQEEKDLKAKILREAEEEKEKEKAKKKKEDEEFEARVRAQAAKAGWSAEYVEDLLHKDEHKHGHHHDHRAHSPMSAGRRNELMIDYQRPKWIRLKSKHVLPETLNAYNLKWDWDEDDDEYIMVKEYISHDLQRDLYAHTKTILQSRRLITPGYEKETITTLKPRDERVIKKKGNQMYMVRRKSVSPAPRRLSFIS